MSDIWKGKSEARVAGKVPSFVAAYVALIDLSRPKEGKMWINQKHRVARLAPFWRDDPSIRAHVVSERAIIFRGLQIIGQVTVASKAVLKIVVANESEHVPRLDPVEQSRVRFRMF